MDTIVTKGGGLNVKITLGLWLDKYPWKREFSDFFTVFIDVTTVTQEREGILPWPVSVTEHRLQEGEPETEDVVRDTPTL